jgi:3-phosphoglycerate kinase
MADKAKVVVLCGSSRFVDIMAVCAWLIERDEQTITMGLHLLPWWYATEKEIPHHLAEHEGVAVEMDLLHRRKIDLADEVFVVNKDDYIGDSTKAEIEYATLLGLPIRWYTHDPIGEKVNKMLEEAINNKL